MFQDATYISSIIIGIRLPLVFKCSVAQQRLQHGQAPAHGTNKKIWPMSHSSVTLASSCFNLLISAACASLALASARGRSYRFFHA
jgi:hypothetical protein